MKKLRLPVLMALMLAAAPALMAAEEPVSSSWHARTLLEAIGNVLLFAAIGIAAAVVGFKVFDRCTPGNLSKEILEHKNVAAAIVAGAVIVGVSIIIAAAMVG